MTKLLCSTLVAFTALTVWSPAVTAQIRLNQIGFYPGAPKNCDKAGIDADCNGLADTQEAACGAKEHQCGDDPGQVVARTAA